MSTAGAHVYSKKDRCRRFACVDICGALAEKTRCKMLGLTNQLTGVCHKIIISRRLIANEQCV